MFLPIGEKLNATRKSVASSIKERNAELVREVLESQIRSGAAMIDVNGGTSPKKELENLLWLTEIAAAACDAPLCIDSANPEVIKAAAEKCLQVRSVKIPDEFELKPGLPWLMINSINNNPARFETLLPVVKQFNCAVVALCMGDGEAPSGAPERIKIGAELVERLTGEGIEASRIYVDPLVMPVGVDTKNALTAIEIIRELKQMFPGLRSVCGLSNVSYGLPARPLLNRTFLTVAAAGGLDAAIMDTTDKKLMSALHAARALSNNDEYCADYISAFRKEMLVS